MFWAFALAGALGLALGLRFRVAAILAASSIVLVGGAITFALSGWPIWLALAASFGAMATLQGSYVVGLLLACAASRLSLPSFAAYYAGKFRREPGQPSACI